MDSFEGFSAEDLARWQQILELQKKASNSLSDYYEILKNLKELEANIRHINKEKAKTESRLVELERKRARLARDTRHMTNAEYIETLRLIEAEKKQLEIAEEMLRIGQQNVNALSQSLNRTNLLLSSTKSLVGALKVVGNHLDANTGYWLEQEKATKMSAFNLGILSNQSKTFGVNLANAATKTLKIGVDTKQLAQMQSQYAEESGRALQFNEAALKAVADISKGTILGAEGAASMVSEMSNFNISATKSSKLVESILNDAHSMGLSAVKSTKMLERNMKLANKYNFKEGIKGLGKMVNLASKFKLEMNQIAGFADKVFDIEGANEMAAQLQVLGGGWSKLGDPFQLMFKARTDLKGFTEDIISATEVTGRFNKQNGEITIDPLEMSRLREVAKVTGMDMDMLSESIKTFRKQSEAKSRISGFGFSDEDKEYISTLAEFDENRGEFKVRLDGQDYYLNEMHKLNARQLKALKNQKATLEQRAKDTLTFDETWQNIKDTFKTALLPGFMEFSSTFKGTLDKIMKWMEKNNIIEGLTNFGTELGKTASWFIEKIVEWPKTSAAIIGAGIIGKELMWLERGMLLGRGFNMTASSSIGSSISRSGMGAFNQTAGGSLGKNIGGAALSKASIIGGVAAGVFNGLKEYSDNSENGMDQKENLGRSFIKGGTTGVGGWGGAAMGAALGTALLPGIGTIVGGIAGGLAGALGGDIVGEKINSGVYGKKVNDFIARPGKDPIPFNSADTLVGLKKDGGIGRALVEGSVGKGGKTEVRFTNPLKIEGVIELRANDKVGEIDMSNPMIIRALTRLIQEELTKNIGGGKLSPSPIL